MGKKLGIGVIVLSIIGAIYYFTSGAEQLTSQMKVKVDSHLASLQTQGFSVSGREVYEKKEYFEISMDETQKVAEFLNNKGIQISTHDLKELKGLTFAVEVNYLADTYSAASFDIYPLTLPTSLISSAIDEDEKKLLVQVQDMIKNKTFLLHIDINKLGTGFKGHMKDINEVLKAEDEISFIMTALNFSGDIKDNKLSSINQTLENLNITSTDDMLKMKINNLKSSHTLTGISKYDYHTDYEIGEIVISSDKDFKLTLNGFIIDSTSKVTDSLALVTVNSKLSSLHYTQGAKTSTLDTIAFDMQAKNFDMQALEKLENINPDNEEELFAVFQKLISHGIFFEIKDFSIKNITFEKQKIEGFSLTSAFDIDKSFDLSTIEKNPMVAIGAMNANLKLTLSKALFGFVAQHPSAMMALMLFQPQEVNGKKVYEVDLKDGKLMVNGRPVM